MFETPNVESLIEAAANYLTIRMGAVSLGPVETSVFIVALAAAVLSGFNLWRISGYEDRQDRLATLRAGAVFNNAQRERPRGPRWYTRLGRLIAASPIIGIAEQRRLLRALATAGIKGHGDLATFVASKLCGAVAFVAVTWLFLEWKHLLGGLPWIRAALLLGAVLLGWRFPDVVLARLAVHRRRRIEQGMPDAIDLLVICAEAGLSLDQAIEQAAEEMRAANSPVAEELSTTAAEMRVLRDRGEALENLVRRTGLASLLGITATLTQAIRFGTPLADSLRVLAAEMRVQRIAQLEERAARLPVLLTIPMMLFILPCLLIVIGTPVALRVGDTLRQVIHKAF